MEKTENTAMQKDAYTYDEAVDLTGHGKYNYLLLFTCSVIINAVSLDMFGFATVVAAASCDLNLNLTQLGLLAAAPFAGVLFAFPWGYYADTQGRWRAILISTSVGFVFAFVSSFSTHWIFMLVMKVIGSSFSTASFTLTITLLGECTGQKYLSRYLFIMNSFNIASEFLAFSLAWLILPLNINMPMTWLDTTFRSWRLYSIALSIPMGLGACLTLCLYESPKYLASRGDYVKALEVLKQIYERNGGQREEYPVKHLLKSLMDKESVIKEHERTFWSSLKRQTLPIFQRPLLWRTIQLFFLMSLCCLTNNMFIMWFPTIVNYFFNSFNGMDTGDESFCQRMFGEANISPDTQTFKCNENLSLNTLYSGMLFGLFYFCCSFSVVKIASRPKLLLILILTISMISFLCVNVKHPIANMIFFTLLQDTALGIGCISPYFVNLYPTAQRGLVTSLSMMVARLSSLVGVSVIGNILTSYCEATFYAWSVVVASGILVCFFLPADGKAAKSTNKHMGISDVHNN